jgi:hypothetical protein
MWNDSADGRFYKQQILNADLAIGDNIVAKTVIYGEFSFQGFDVNYRGVNKVSAKQNKGLASKFSNSLSVDKSEYINLNGKEAKVLPVPYINQWLEPNGKFFPKDGWQMCGAASAVMVVGYYKKLDYNPKNEHSLKPFMYSNNGQGITATCGPDKGGAFGITNFRCNQSYAGGIINYLKWFNIDTNEQLIWKYSMSFETIKDNIDKGKPIIYSYHDSTNSNFGHISVIIGYTIDKKIILNDPYSDLPTYGRKWMNYDTGRLSVHDYNSKRWPPFYYILLN